MKKIFTFISALLITLSTLTLSGAWAQQNDVMLEFKPSVSTANNGDEFTVDVILKNPDQQSIISVRTWLAYNPDHLEGLAIDTADSPFTLSAPGEDAFDAGSGHVKIGRSNISGGVTDAEVTIATVAFKAKTNSAVTTELKPHDYQLTELGHTSVNIIDQGFPVNVLSSEPDSLMLALNGGSGASGGGASAPSATPIDLSPPAPVLTPSSSSNLLVRPTNVRVNTGSGFADLKWDGPVDPHRAGFNVYYGKTSGQYSRRRTLNDINSTRIEGLNNGEAYFFAITAYDLSNQESDYSDEVGVIIGQPLSSTAPFAGVLQAALNKLPNQPQNGPLTWWVLFSAMGLSGTLIFRKQT